MNIGMYRIRYTVSHLDTFWILHPPHYVFVGYRQKKCSGKRIKAPFNRFSANTQREEGPVSPWIPCPRWRCSRA